MTGAEDRLLHVLMVRLDDPGAASEDRFIEGLRDLMGEVRIEGWTVRRDLRLRPGHPRSNHLLVTVPFTDSDAFLSYVESEPHLRFLEDVARPLKAEIAAIQVGDIPTVDGRLMLQQVREV